MDSDIEEEIFEIKLNSNFKYYNKPVYLGVAFTNASPRQYLKMDYSNSYKTDGLNFMKVNE